MIYVNGDSWSRNLWIEWSPFDWCWVKQLSDSTGHPVQNDAAGCASNSRIVDKLLMAHAGGGRYDLAIMGLTCPQRWYLPSTLFSYWNIGPTVLEEKTYTRDEQVHPWFIKNCLNDTNMIVSYYKTIWQIQIICNEILKCPVIFFNAWDEDIYNFHQKIFCHKDQIRKWSRLPEHGLDRLETNNLDNIMCFLHDESKNWLLHMRPWTHILTDQSDFDGAKDRDPGHPSRKGHQKIASHVLNVINQTVPDIFK